MSHTNIKGWASSNRLPPHGAVGAALVAASWLVSWMHVEPVGRHAFFPLWLGYILIVDAVVLRRSGTSLLTRSPRRFAGMFVAAAPLWWGFEAINRLTQNWRYMGVEHYSAIEYALLASLSFSTVIPAVFETAELIGTFGFIQRFRRWPSVRLSLPARLAAVVMGALSILMLTIWPRYAFPLTWLGAFIVLDPINQMRGLPSIGGWLERGDWRLPVALALGAMVCGGFWEMWNYWAFPKWVYSIPMVDFAHIFEMPALGYAGYLPFGLEVYAGYHFLAGSLGSRHPIIRLPDHGWTPASASPHPWDDAAV